MANYDAINKPKVTSPTGQKLYEYYMLAVSTQVFIQLCVIENKIFERHEIVSIKTYSYSRIFDSFGCMCHFNKSKNAYTQFNRASKAKTAHKFSSI